MSDGAIHQGSSIIMDGTANASKSEANVDARLESPLAEIGGS